MKWLLVVFHEMFPELPAMTVSLTCAVTCSLAFLNHKWRPCQHVWAVNHWRAAAFYIIALVAFSSLLALLSPAADSGSVSSADILARGSTVVLIVGTLCIGVGFSLKQFRRTLAARGRWGRASRVAVLAMRTAKVGIERPSISGSSGTTLLLARLSNAKEARARKLKDRPDISACEGHDDKIK